MGNHESKENKKLVEFKSSDNKNIKIDFFKRTIDKKQPKNRLDCDKIISKSNVKKLISDKERIFSFAFKITSLLAINQSRSKTNLNLLVVNNSLIPCKHLINDEKIKSQVDKKIEESSKFINSLLEVSEYKLKKFNKKRKINYNLKNYSEFDDEIFSINLITKSDNVPNIKIKDDGYSLPDLQYVNKQDNLKVINIAKKKVIPIRSNPVSLKSTNRTKEKGEKVSKSPVKNSDLINKTKRSPSPVPKHNKLNIKSSRNYNPTLSNIINQNDSKTPKKLFKIDLRNKESTVYLDTCPSKSSFQTNENNFVSDFDLLSCNTINAARSEADNEILMTDIIYKKKTNSGFFSKTQKNTSINTTMNMDNNSNSYNNTLKSINSIESEPINKQNINNYSLSLKAASNSNSVGSYVIMNKQKKALLEKKQNKSNDKPKNSLKSSSLNPSKSSENLLFKENRPHAKLQPKQPFKSSITPYEEKMVFKIDLSSKDNLKEIYAQDVSNDKLMKIKNIQRGLDKKNQPYINAEPGDLNDCQFPNHQLAVIRENSGEDLTEFGYRFSFKKRQTPKFPKLSEDKNYYNQTEPNIRYNFEINEKIDEHELQDVDLLDYS